MDTLIRGGTAALLAGEARADILIREGRISAVSPEIGAPGVRVIDAAGLLILPGGVDVHTHFDLMGGAERTSDDWLSGTVSAACGGTTTVVDHPGFGPRGCSLFHQINAYHALAAGAAAVDYSFHGVIQRVDADILRDLEELARAGIPSVKAYLTYDYRLEDAEILQLLKRMRSIGGVTCVHCEDHQTVAALRERFKAEGKGEPRYHALSRPAAAEAQAVARMVRLSAEAGGAILYVVHLSSAAGLAEVRAGRKRGLPVFAETCPQYLLLTEERYEEPDLGGLKYVMSPPLRTPEDARALLGGSAGREHSDRSHGPLSLQLLP